MECPERGESDDNVCRCHHSSADRHRDPFLGSFRVARLRRANALDIGYLKALNLEVGVNVVGKAGRALEADEVVVAAWYMKESQQILQGHGLCGGSDSLGIDPSVRCHGAEPATWRLKDQPTLLPDRQSQSSLRAFAYLVRLERHPSDSTDALRVGHLEPVVQLLNVTLAVKPTDAQEAEIGCSSLFRRSRLQDAAVCNLRNTKILRAQPSAFSAQVLVVLHDVQTFRIWQRVNEVSAMKADRPFPAPDLKLAVEAGVLRHPL